MGKPIPEMRMREFLRGGYKSLRSPVLLTWHGKPVFTVTPVEYSVPQGLLGADTLDPATRTVVASATPPSRESTTRSYAGDPSLPRWLRGEEGP
jgi:hypothetical protein